MKRFSTLLIASIAITAMAGSAAFITGQSPMRTGLTKVGLPGAPAPQLGQA